MEYEHANGNSTSPHLKGDHSFISDPADSTTLRIPTRALYIIWGNDPRYWDHIKLTQEDKQLIGFEEGSVLLQVNWLVVTGKMAAVSLLSPAKTNTILYIIKFRADAFGWHSSPIKFKVRVDGGQETQRTVILELYRVKQDMWHEVPGGEFTLLSNNNIGSSTSIVEFGMFCTLNMQRMY
ncbi:F-box protein PP2-B11-like [Cornus florida]|uniref:F-box protein PP2-B11-like n=1 Tax=Cornus florida TaxID=4283 RepID=UPI00289FD479|nr:F-box protein PP2-B11-like [Cornus florida]